MRIAGYVRERPPADDAEPAFAQGERIRRWVAEHGHLLVAVCHDQPDPTTSDHPPVAPGFAALLAVADGGAIDAVVVASIDDLADDILDQEIRRWELRRRGARVRSTTDGDDTVLDDAVLDGEPVLGEDDRDRALARRLLDRLDGGLPDR